MGVGVSKLAYIAMTGANTPSTLFADDAIPTAVPLILAGNISGVYA